MNFDDIIPAIQGRNWYAVAALVIWAIVAFAKSRAPELYYRIPDGWRWLPPVLLAAATGFVDGFASGLPWQQAATRALFAVLTMGVGAMGVHGALAASPLKYGGGPSAVLLALGLSIAAPTGCTAKPAQSAAAEKTAALAYTGAVVALEVLDAREAAYLDSALGSAHTTGKTVADQGPELAELLARMIVVFLAVGALFLALASAWAS